MSLASPLSIGDAILLSQICYKVALAFSSGARSAPAEFAEVQSLLYSATASVQLLERTLLRQGLDGGAESGAATDAQEREDEPGTELVIRTGPESMRLARSTGDTPTAPDAAATEIYRRIERELLEGPDAETYRMLGNIVSNLQAVLKNLEVFVNQYSVLEAKGEPGERRWKESIQRNWKKVKWTTEGDDISKLKQTLSLHIDALNLALAVVSRTQQDSIRDDVGEIRRMFNTLYQWFGQNLQGRTIVTPSADTPPDAATPPPAQARGLCFAVYEEFYSLSSAPQRRLLCPWATFALDLFPPSFGQQQQQQQQQRIFACRCPSLRGRHEPFVDHSADLAFRLAPSSMLTQVGSPAYSGCWQMYVWDDHAAAQASVVISGVMPVCRGQLQEWIDRLAVAQTLRHIEAGLSSGFVRHDAESVSLLTMKSNLLHLAHRLLEVRFRVNKQFFKLSKPSSLLLLHYARVFKHPVSGPPGYPAPEAQIEVLLGPSSGASQPSGSQDIRHSIIVPLGTKPADPKGRRDVTFWQADVTQQRRDSAGAETITDVKCTAVELEFSDDASASEFYSTLSYVLDQLRIKSLQTALWGERTVYSAPIDAPLSVGPFAFSTGTASVVRERAAAPTAPARHRLMLLRRDRSVSVCTALPAGFPAEDGRSADGSPEPAAWFVEAGVEGLDVWQGDGVLRELGPLLERAREELRREEREVGEVERVESGVGRLALTE